MSEDDIRWSDLPSRVGTAVPSWPAGTFTMTVDMARHGLTRGGKTKITITLLCVEGPMAGQFYMWDLVLDPKNPRYFTERLHTLGADADFLGSNPSLGEISLHIIGLQHYRVTFKDSEINGRPTTEISYLERA